MSRLVAKKRDSFISLLQLDHFVLVGMPGDYAGELAQSLDAQCQERKQTLFLTSFNGDYKGYFVTRETWENYDEYETRNMNFFGPSGGDYLNASASELIRKVP